MSKFAYVTGKNAAGETTHIALSQITHVTLKTNGDHVAQAGDGKSIPPVTLAPGEWDKIK
jgi:hypothetical protein